ncbi:hypothetical protein F2P81_014078 [Scophthalmus maximus]|uniref:Uncharacterized protein n=1 Tax=Scophthalmus maximus TaxID=52904 RepID=A0A6A4SV97_SCOMX|nr:hypothetical protein F2P81_014078 [Scophthalmus maximus]
MADNNLSSSLSHFGPASTRRGSRCRRDSYEPQQLPHAHKIFKSTLDRFTAKTGPDDRSAMGRQTGCLYDLVLITCNPSRRKNDTDALRLALLHTYKALQFVRTGTVAMTLYFL